MAEDQTLVHSPGRQNESIAYMSPYLRMIPKAGLLLSGLVEYCEIERETVVLLTPRVIQPEKDKEKP